MAYNIILLFENSMIRIVLHDWNMTRSKCALDKRKILCLDVPGFQRQLVRHVKTLSE